MTIILGNPIVLKHTHPEFIATWLVRYTADASDERFRVGGGWYVLHQAAIHTRIINGPITLTMTSVYYRPRLKAMLPDMPQLSIEFELVPIFDSSGRTTSNVQLTLRCENPTFYQYVERLHSELLKEFSIATSGGSERELPKGLNNTQRTVLTNLWDGKSIEDSAAEAYIAPRTVRNIESRLRVRLGEDTVPYR